MSARVRAERDRRRSVVLSAVALALAVWGVVGAVLGYARYGIPGPTDLVVVVAALALLAHAEVYRLRAVVERVAERAGDPS